MKKALLLIFISLIASCSNGEPTTISSTSPSSSPNITTPEPTATTSATPTNANLQSAKVTEILDGEQVFIQDRKAAINDIAKSQEQVRTGETRAEIVFNNDAIARLSKNSLLTVGKCGAQLQKGSVLINGAVSACTPSMSAAVRGTTYLLEIDEEGNDQIQVLEGEVLITRNEAADQIQIVRSGERFRNFRKTKKALLQKISESEYEAILVNPLFRGYRRDLPNLGKVRAKFQVLFPNARPLLEKRNDLKNDLKQLERSEIKEKLENRRKDDDKPARNEARNDDDKPARNDVRKDDDDKPARNRNEDEKLERKNDKKPERKEKDE
ncbi:FecR domain-containing protein [Pseudanabaena biceps]|nr:FecR domain-containing protein [Pseudanabaena biceps]